MMMYDFDGSVLALSAEALTFAGVCLDRELSGYRTLSVSGRDGMRYEQNTEEGWRGRKKAARTLTVTYQILSDSPEAYRETLNRLNYLTDQEQAQIIVADEPDKYFVGSKLDHIEPELSYRNSIGSFSIRCTDPHKYSLAESVFQSYTDDGQVLMTILNNGTLPVPIDFTITHTDENGYLCISDGLHTLEYGDRIEPDEEERVLSVYAVRNWQSFNSPPYTDNAYTAQSDVNTAGSWQTDGAGLLYPYSYGEFASGKRWRGVSRSYELEKPAALPNMQNWEADWCIYHSYSRNAQRGLQWFGVLNSDNAMVCGVKIIKDQQGSMWTSVQFWVRGLGYCKTISTTSVGTDIAKDGRHIKIDKSGDTVTFRYGGADYSFVAPDLAEMDAGKLYFSAYAMDAAADQVSFRIQGVWFRVDSSYMYDLPNRYADGSVCEINGKTREFFVNGSYRPEDELLGADYFMAEPGITRLTFGFSPFCQEKPTVTARIREGWL